VTEKTVLTFEEAQALCPGLTAREYVAVVEFNAEAAAYAAQKSAEFNADKAKLGFVGAILKRFGGDDA